MYDSSFVQATIMSSVLRYGTNRVVCVHMWLYERVCVCVCVCVCAHVCVMVV